MESNEQNLERALGVVEGKMDSMITTMERLANAFDNLEKGRLSTLEINFTKFYTEISTKSKNTAMWTSAIMSGVVSIAVALIIYFLKI